MSGFLCRHAGAYTPAEPWNAFVARLFQDDGLPRFDVGSASAIDVSRPQWRSLAFRPVDSRGCQGSPFHRRLSRTCHLLHDSDCYWPERLLPGGTCLPLKTKHLSRRTSKIEPFDGSPSEQRLAWRDSLWWSCFRVVCSHQTGRGHSGQGRQVPQGLSRIVYLMSLSLSSPFLCQA